MRTHAVVISGFGVNCEYETAYSIKKAGGSADIVHLNTLIDAPSLLQTYNFIVFPGGFSYSDHLGAAKVFSNKVFYKLKEHISSFAKEGKLIMGVCNGFQALAKIGLLPYPNFEKLFTLTYNDSGKFEDRWVRLKTNKKSPCIFTRDIEYLDLPVRHGEGKFIPKDEKVLLDILNNNLCPLQYVDSKGRIAGYPYNPNGSVQNVAAICDPSGRIFGLMPHPEAYNDYTNHPFWTFKKPSGISGIKVFENAVNYLKEQP